MNSKLEYNILDCNSLKYCIARTSEKFQVLEIFFNIY